MCSQNPHALFQRFTSDGKKSDLFIHVDGVNLIACLERTLTRNDIVKILVSVGFGEANRFFYAFPFCLSDIKEIAVVFCELFQFC